MLTLAAFLIGCLAGAATMALARPDGDDAEVAAVIAQSHIPQHLAAMLDDPRRLPPQRSAEWVCRQHITVRGKARVLRVEVSLQSAEAP
jgi:hypothetical protein